MPSDLRSPHENYCLLWTPQVRVSRECGRTQYIKYNLQRLFFGELNVDRGLLAGRERRNFGLATLQGNLAITIEHPPQGIALHAVRGNGLSRSQDDGKSTGLSGDLQA